MDGRLIAVLGPTNTGKTHLAMERMLGHRSGMIGFPLRLLARENYDRVVAAKGAGAVALLTGEEKIIPPHPRWFVCTVEAMPLDRRVDFLAIDEIQLAADPERGHVFTDRLLNARGETETMVLGADTIRPLLRRLVPTAEFVSRPRFSQLSWSGPRKLTRLPPRSAIVAFSASEVYALAELVRRQRGGAAVVLGALSPRTRNAQVELYQAGDVDYLVATDAIGMGLNMDVDHVAFAAGRKFDGRVPRDLTASEVAQIAGRAGRHMNDGTFGTTGDAGGFEPALIDAVENHNFQPLQRLQWRNSRLVFTSAGALLASLNRLPEQPGLIRARDADDQLVLQAVLRHEEAAGRADTPARIRLLWEVCQIPDFRKVQAEQHSRLVAAIFSHLSASSGHLPADWLDAQVKRVDRVDGDIDTLMTRIANVRTWTYVSHRADWVRDARHWQERTRDIEDRLSDALHQRLSQRFIDRRTAVLVRKLKDGGDLLSAVAADGDVKVEGHFVGRLDGFRFVADAAEGTNATRAVSAAAQKALRQEIAGRVNRAATDPDDLFSLDDQGVLCWRQSPVARLAAGPEPLRPSIALLPTDLVEGPSRALLQLRLDTWLAGFRAARLEPLITATGIGGDATGIPLSGAARGLTFQLGEALGSIPRPAAAPQVAALSADDRKSLARLGVRLGMESIYMPALLKPPMARLRSLLWCIRHDCSPVPTVPAGRTSLPVNGEIPSAWYEAVGYRCLGPRAVRVDILERVAATARHSARQGEFALPADLPSLLGCSLEDADLVLKGLGYRAGALKGHYAAARRPGKRPRDPAAGRERHHDSPFAALKRLNS